MRINNARHGHRCLGNRNCSDLWGQHGRRTLYPRPRLYSRHVHKGSVVWYFSRLKANQNVYRDSIVLLIRPKPRGAWLGGTRQASVPGRASHRPSYSLFDVGKHRRNFFLFNYLFLFIWKGTKMHVFVGVLQRCEPGTLRFSLNRIMAITAMLSNSFSAFTQT